MKCRVGVWIALVWWAWGYGQPTGLVPPAGEPPTWAQPLFKPSPLLEAADNDLVVKPLKPTADLREAEVQGHVPLTAAPARLLDAVREGGWDEAAAYTIARCTPESWAVSFPTQAERLAAYLNLYNAYSLHLTRPEHLATNGSRRRHFGNHIIPFARMLISLNQLEHGLLRQGQLWFGMGYVRTWLRPAWQRYLQVNRLDARLHFALNCGARSCPPIRHYHAQWLEAQLETATKSYLQQTVVQRGDTLYLPRILAWYRGDFGGSNGIRRLLKRHGMPYRAARLRYLPWDWAAQHAATPPDAVVAQEK